MTASSRRCSSWSAARLGSTSVNTSSRASGGGWLDGWPLRRLTTLGEYVRLLRDEPAEVQALFEDILIHVTSFFRDGDAFEKLKEYVFPDILRQKRRDGTIRIWSAGCSTGEETYSLLIALLEFLAQENASDVPVQLFGTDISEKAIEKARAGFYPDGALRDVSAERLTRFFTKVEGGGYRINKSVRERCAFVKHDLASRSALLEA